MAANFAALALAAQLVASDAGHQFSSAKEAAQHVKEACMTQQRKGITHHCAHWASFGSVYVYQCNMLEVKSYVHAMG